MSSQAPLLITGGSGYLGRHLTVKAAKTFAVTATYHREAEAIEAGQPLRLDITNRSAVLETVAALKPRAIIHTAAINPGRGDEGVMKRVNAEGSRYVAEAAVAVGARLIHVSTDVVHDGRQAPYADESPPNPLNGYGRSKAAAEANVAVVDPRAVIVRTSLIYGLEEMDRGTAGFAARLVQGEPLVLFSDVIRQPVWVETLAEALLRLIEIEVSGSLNVAGRQALTREAFGRRLLTYWGVAGQDRVTSSRAADISSAIPLDLRLSVAKGERLLGMRFVGVDEVLDMIV